jgi:hypothetical protein
MIRPPPLHLKYDNRFPHPLRTPKNPKAQGRSFASTLYLASWKNVVIAFAGLNGLRFILAAHTHFEDAITDDLEISHNLAKISTTLGLIYVFASLVDLYGILSVSMQRPKLIQTYLYLTLLSSLMLISAGVLKGMVYLSFSEELMWECVSLATKGQAFERSTFRADSWPGKFAPVSESLARKGCIASWQTSSTPLTQLLTLLIFTLLPTALGCVLVSGYARQVRERGHAAFLGDHYHDGGGSGYMRVASALTRTAQQIGMRAAGSVLPRPRVPPQGGPPPRANASQGLKRAHRPPPLVPSPESFGVGDGDEGVIHAGYTSVGNGNVRDRDEMRRAGNLGRSRMRRVYAAFAAPAPPGF